MRFQWFQKLSIRWKLTLIIIGVTTVISISQIMAFNIYDSQTFRESKRLRVRALAEVVSMNSISALVFGDRNDALEIIGSLRASPTIRVAYLLNKDGGLFAEYLREGEKLSVPLLVPKKEVEYFEEDRFVLVRNIFMGKDQVGSIYVDADLQDLKKRQNDGILLGVIVGATSLVASSLLALWFQKTLTNPINSLVQTIQRIRSNNTYHARAPKLSEDEFGVLVSGFNHMLSEIEERDRRLAEQVKKLELVNKELDQFVYVASHDLKAPLRGVDNLSHLIAKETAHLLEPEKREYLDLIQNRVQRMEKLLDDLLAYSRVGKMQARVEKVDCNVLIVDIVELLSAPPGFSICAQELPCFNTYKTPLEQVFRNLINNAVKHHNRLDGKIIVTSLEQEKFYEFIVSDDGPGISSRYHDKIFQMFQTLRPRDEVEGSGMGLALVKKIIEEQKGEVWVESSEGEGAQFHFTWPKINQRTPNEI